VKAVKKHQEKKGFFNKMKILFTIRLPLNSHLLHHLSLQLVQRSSQLQLMCGARVRAAARFRDLQIENIRGLYEYDVK